MVLEVPLGGFESLGERRGEARVDERDPAVTEIVEPQVDTVLARRTLDAVQDAAVSVEKELPNDIGLVSETEDEIVVTPPHVEPHDLPQDRAPPDFDHGLGNPPGCLTHADAKTAAENHHFHPLPPRHSLVGARGSRQPPGSAPSSI